MEETMPAIPGYEILGELGRGDMGTFTRLSANRDASLTLKSHVRARKSIIVTHWLYCAW